MPSGLLRALVDEFHPSSPTQLMLVETMAVARWRQLRVWGLQKVSLDREMALQDPLLGPPEVRAVLAFNQSPTAATAELLLRYEVALDRQFARALARLIAVQSNPNHQGPAPFHPASLAGLTWKQSPDPDSASEPPSMPPAPAPAKRTQQLVDSSRLSSTPSAPNSAAVADNPFDLTASARPSDAAA